MARADLFLHSLHVPIRKAPPPPRLENLQFHYAVSQILLKASLPLESQVHEVLRLIGEHFKLHGASLSLNTKRDSPPITLAQWGEPLGEPAAGPRMLGDPPPMEALRVPLGSSHLPIGDLIFGRTQPFTRAEEATLHILASQLTSHIAEQQRHRQAQQMALTDGLTGLSNHRAFQEMLHLTLHAAKGATSLILVDIDHFKQVNDRHGHLFGDRILSQVAALLGTSVREPDFVARYGGEEFALLLPDTPLEGALILAERLRQCIADEAFVGDDTVMSVTISLGVAVCPPGGGIGSEALIRQADLALYAAKRRGRNQVRSYDPSLTMVEAKEDAPHRVGSKWLSASAEMVLSSWAELAAERRWPLPIASFVGEVLPAVLTGLAGQLAAGADDGGVVANDAALAALASQYLAHALEHGANILQAALSLQLLSEIVAGFIDGIALSPAALATLQQQMAKLFHALETQLLLKGIHLR